MKKIALFALGLVMSLATFAQDEVEATISGDIVSQYIWRGQDLGNAAIQPASRAFNGTQTSRATTG